MAIVIFGAAVRSDGQPSKTLHSRVEAAFAFGRSLDAPTYVPTGGIGKHGPSEASVMSSLLLEWGVPESRILREDTAINTLSSVRAVRSLLRRHTGPVYAASSAYHLPRCVLLLRLAGLPARACPPPDVPAAQTFRRRWYWRFRETVALPVDGVVLIALRLSGRL